MRLNRADARCLGVCAGVADWLEVPTTLVRIVFLICVLSWPPLILGYFCLYFCMDKDITPEKMQHYFRNAKTAEHFRQLDYRKPIYKNRRHKRIAGVCAGIADYLEVSAFAIRAVTLLSLFIFGPFTFWAYIICIFVFDDDPNAPHSNRYERYLHRKQRRAERRAARRRGRRNSYVNEEFTDDMADFKAGIGDAVERVKDEISAEVGDAWSQAEQNESARQKSKSASGAKSYFSRQECTDIYNSLELRLREIEAYITSKRFRLHCEINRI